MAAARSGLKVCGLRAEVGDPYTDRQLTPTRRADGPSACPGNSLHEPGTCRRERQFLGTWSKPKNPFACGTLAKSFASGPVQLSNELDHRPCAISMRDARIVTVRAPRARFLAQSFRTPLGEEGTETSRQALGPE